MASIGWNSMVIAGLFALALASGGEPTSLASPDQGLKPDGSLRKWLVLRPIPVSGGFLGRLLTPGEEAQRRVFGEDLFKDSGGESGVKPRAGEKVAIGGREFEWTPLESKTDAIDLKAGKTPEEYSIAYAWGEFDAPAARQAFLGIGSDDAVKVWLNGKLIHENWIGRPVRIDDDIVPADLKEGRNTVLIKVLNMRSEWGFSCRILGPEAQAAKLVAAAREGDLAAAEILLSRGLDVGARAANGLTAVEAARLYGRKEMVEFLVKKGADPSSELPPREKLVEALAAGLVKPDSPGVAFLVARDGKILFEKGYGLARLEPRIPVTPDTKFRIGSITKQFTAAAILKLAEDGKLSLDDRLAKFVPGFPRGDEVTIHHLLTHTSGIHSYTSKPDFMAHVTEGVKPEDHIRSFRDDPYDFDPGAKWSYNNSGFFLLGFIIEKVSGVPYGDYLRRTFFEPLGMKDTGVHVAKGALEQEATGYSYEGGEVKPAIDWDMSKAGGAGAIYSTVRDLCIWNEAVFGGRVLREASLRAAFTPVLVKGEDPSKPKDSGYGYGWAIQKFRETREISHGGGLQGFVSFLLRLPDHGLTVAVLANCAPPMPGVDPGGLAHEVAELWIGEKLAPRPSTAVMTGIRPEVLDAIVGRYDYGGAILTVTREGSRIFAQLTGQQRFEIFPRSEDTFFWKVVEAEVTFVKGKDGKVSEAVHRQGGQTIHALRIAEPAVARVDPKFYDAYAGRYDYGGGKEILTITREGDRLFAQLTGQPRFEIFPSSETKFFWKVANAEVEFVVDGSGKVVKAIHRQGGRTIEAPRLEEAVPGAPESRRRRF